MKILVFISGTPGSGKSTLAEKLAEEYNLETIFASDILKRIVSGEEITTSKTKKGEGFWESEKGMEAFEKRAKNLSYDIKFDKILLKLAREKNRAIFDSRLLPWLYKGNAFRIWIDASEKVRAERVAKRDNISIKDALAKIRKRFEYDAKIYKEIYRIDIKKDRGPFDIVLKTDNYNQEEVFEIVSLALRRFFKI